MLFPLKVFISAVPSLCTGASLSHGQLPVLLDVLVMGLCLAGTILGSFGSQHQGLISVVGGCEKEERQRK